MPVSLLPPCLEPGCFARAVRGGRGRCHAHAPVPDRLRGSAKLRGYDSRWDKARRGYLARHPLCRVCESHGRTTAATVVDHIEPHRGNMALFWNTANWQPLCVACHNRKTGGGR